MLDGRLRGAAADRRRSGGRNTRCAIAVPWPIRSPTPEVLSISDAFRCHAGVDLDAMLSGRVRMGLSRLGRGGARAWATRRRRRRRLVGPVQQDPQRLWSSRTSVIGRATVLASLSGERGGPGTPLPGRYALRRAVRTLCLRRRTRQCLRRAARCRRTASAVRGGGSGAADASMATSLSARRGLPRRPGA